MPAPVSPMPRQMPQNNEVNLMQMLQNAFRPDYLVPNPTDFATPMDDGAGQYIPGEANPNRRIFNSMTGDEMNQMLASQPNMSLPIDEGPLPGLGEAFLGAGQRLTDKIGGRVGGVGDFATEKAKQAEHALIKMLMGMGN